MNRYCTSAVQIAAGVVLGCALSAFYESTHAAPPTAAQIGDELRDKEVVAQLKELNSHVKNIDALMQSGKLKVVNVINPNAR